MLPFYYRHGLHQFGLGITGHANPGNEATQLPEPEDKSHQSCPVESLMKKKTTEFIQEKERFLQYILACLEQNKLIPKPSYCPIPEMKVNLPVPKGTVLLRSPRPYAQKQHTIFYPSDNAMDGEYYQYECLEMTLESGLHRLKGRCN